MEKVSKKDFIEIEYTGKIKEDNTIFDTTDEDIAKENNLETHSGYEPIIICVGEEQLLKGIDGNLEGNDIGKEYDIEE